MTFKYIRQLHNLWAFLFCVLILMKNKEAGCLQTLTCFPCASPRLSLQIGALKDYYHFYHSRTFKRSVVSSRGTHSFISMEPKVRKTNWKGTKKSCSCIFDNTRSPWPSPRLLFLDLSLYPLVRYLFSGNTIQWIDFYWPASGIPRVEQLRVSPKYELLCRMARGCRLRTQIN